MKSYLLRILFVFLSLAFYKLSIGGVGNEAEIKIKNYSSKTISSFELTVCGNTETIDRSIRMLSEYMLSLQYNCDGGIKYLINFSDGTSIQGDDGYLSIFNVQVSIFVEASSVSIYVKHISTL